MLKQHGDEGGPGFPSMAVDLDRKAIAVQILVRPPLFYKRIYHG